jgi:hypothetical protein
MESRAITVVGRIDEVRQLQAQGYSARIWVERVLGAASAKYEEGAPLRLAWEELAPSRPPRFGESERVLVVLERLGSASIWKTRIPDPLVRRQTLAVANNGDAFLLDPGLASVDLLHHYLALPSEDRNSTTGLQYLASLTRTSSLPLAVAAARRLGSVPELDKKLGRPGEEALVAALAREDAEPELFAALLPALRAANTASLTKRLRQATRRRKGSAPPARLFAALAIVSNDGLSKSDFAWLVARDDPAYRRVAARSAPPNQAASLRRLLSEDPDSVVRAAALQRLVSIGGADGLPDALSGLADPAPRVRAIASERAASFGDDAVPALRSVAYGDYPGCCTGSIEAARSAIAGLSLAGPSGRVALVEIARDHPDPTLRKLADIALGDLNLEGH